MWWGELIQYHYFKRKNTYVLNQHIAIKKSLTIRAVAESDGEFSTDEKALGLHNAHIQMKGTDNLFRINSTDTLVQLNLKELDLEGCGKTSCAEQGGLIYNKGQLILEYNRLFNAAANLGGAIYNAGKFGQNLTSRAQIKNSLIENNKAQRGGILYSELPAFLIYQSVLKIIRHWIIPRPIFIARDSLLTPVKIKVLVGRY